MDQKSLVLFSFSLLFFTPSLSQELCHPQDKKILLQIKEHFGSPYTMASWDPNTDCCSEWRNVLGCNAQGRVTGLRVSMLFVDFRGEFPAALCDLTRLESLDISDIPSLSGRLPRAFSKLASLRTINVMNTNLTGPIFPFLARFGNLTNIVLDTNGFTGRVPSSLARLKRLETLMVFSSAFSGPLPDVFDRTASLAVVIFHASGISGPIPASLGLLPNLTQLVLTQNKLSGRVPETLGGSNIQFLELGFNRLTGDPTSSLFRGNNTAIESIVLRNNSFKFDFSRANDPPRSLRSLDLSHNRIYGSLPRRLGQWPLQTIDVSYNRLCGPIPTGRRLNQLDPSLFANNKCLCGRPLPPCK